MNEVNKNNPSSSGYKQDQEPPKPKPAKMQTPKPPETKKTDKKDN